MHHTPSGPPLSARFTAALTRAARLMGRAIRLRGVRWPLAAACGFVATVAVLVPVVLPSGTAGGAGTSALNSPAALSAADRGGSLVQLGVDGAGSPVPGVPSAAPGRGTTGTGTTGTTGATAGSPTGTSPSGTQTLPGNTAGNVPVGQGTATTPSGAPSADNATVVPPAGTTSSSSSSSAPSSSRSSSAPSSSSSSVPAPAASGDPSAEGQVFALVNQQRAAAGCGDLVADAGLTALARAHSADMRDRHFFDHTNPDGLSPFDRAAQAGVNLLAENIAYGQPDPASVMAAWMNSPGHRANILNCGLHTLGVGVADGAGGLWWTQDFA